MINRIGQLFEIAVGSIDDGQQSAHSFLTAKGCGHGSLLVFGHAGEAAPEIFHHLPERFHIAAVVCQRQSQLVHGALHFFGGLRQTGQHGTQRRTSL